MCLQQMNFLFSSSFWTSLMAFFTTSVFSYKATSYLIVGRRVYLRTINATKNKIAKVISSRIRSQPVPFISVAVLIASQPATRSISLEGRRFSTNIMAGTRKYVFPYVVLV
ncbi:uncharacterized protein LOC114876439 isoform X2 [Osmia bicornis bicornis]|uniref:uncharacterized protein LOC114876439 isoform X2 n=1 Tax=Osmia bicornis bicornis TaxID=1437191 RepID=UPI001EAEA574|nr:uncharacterized protein LOC114876439 isoform X2 [Osmia bicornis bicornis]